MTDLNMPIMTGEALIKSIRAEKEFEQPKIIVFTGGVKNNFTDHENDLSRYIDGLLYKPFSQEVISDIIASCFDEPGDGVAS